MNEHPNILDLELARGGEGDKTILRHLEHCEECARRVASLHLLREALDDRHPTDVTFAPKHEDPMFRYIAAHAAAIQRRGSRIIPFPPNRILLRAAAAVALVGLGSFIWLHEFKPASSPSVSSLSPATEPPADLNRDGCIDIIDAYLLAAELSAGRDQPAERDVNGDGRIDGEDVETIAARAVSLSPEDHS